MVVSVVIFLALIFVGFFFFGTDDGWRVVESAFGDFLEVVDIVAGRVAGAVTFGVDFVVAGTL